MLNGHFCSCLTSCFLMWGAVPQVRVYWALQWLRDICLMISESGKIFGRTYARQSTTLKRILLVAIRLLRNTSAFRIALQSL